MAVAVTHAADGLRLSYFRMNAGRAKPLAAFYEEALGFRQLSLEHLSGACMETISPTRGRALRITLALGDQRVRLLQFVDKPGRPYPDHAQSSDLIFQHLAIVVADMDAAMQRLSAVAGWSSISCDGAQQLPKSSGGVTAFKFRDPEGHPLELLAFPLDDTPQHWRRESSTTPFLGIDHSAISVSESARSVAFYEALGLKVSNRSVNDGPAQARLDHLDQPVVEVTAMSAGASPPHLELLCYRHGGKGDPMHMSANDVAATCLVFERCLRPEADLAGRPPAQNLVDPDGHHLMIAASAV